MKIVSRISLPVIAVTVGFLLVDVLPATAETEIDNPNDEVNKHYAIASERYGEEVQLHSRLDGEEGSQNKVYSINCVTQMFKEVFTGTTDPVDFPIPSEDHDEYPIEKEAVVAPLASYVCKQHGVPMVGFEW